MDEHPVIWGEESPIFSLDTGASNLSLKRLYKCGHKCGGRMLRPPMTDKETGQDFDRMKIIKRSANLPAVEGSAWFAPFECGRNLITKEL